MNILQRLTFNYIAPMLCILSLGTPYADAQCCPSEQPAYGTNWCAILLPLIAGAAAGAGASAVIDKRGKKGQQGYRGPRGCDGQDGKNGRNGHDGKNGHNGCRGPRGEHGKRGARGHRGPRGHQGEPGAPWVADVGQEVTITFELTLTAPLDAGGGSIVPFVEAPDGRILEATHFNSEITTNQIAAVTIANPLYGTYHIGYVIPPHLNPSGAFTADVVSTTRDNTSTLYGPTSWTLPASGNSQQLTEDFTYFINDGITP